MHFKNETCLQVQVTERDTHFQAIASDNVHKNRLKYPIDWSEVSMTIWNAHMKDCMT